MFKITEFGRAIRKLRIDKSVVMMDMANALSVTVSYLSAIETGKSKITKKIFKKIVNYFGLEDEEVEELQKAAENSPVSVKFNLKDHSSEDRQFVATFAKKFDQLTAEQKKQIENLLNESK